MGKSAALSNFHLKADQDGLASLYRAGCQPWNIVSTMAQTKRCWAGPSQFIRVWIQRRICLVMLEARSDLCPAIISSASNGKSILQTFALGSSTHLSARMHGASGGRWHWKLSPRDLIQLLLSTPAQPSSSWESLFALWSGGHIKYQIAISAQEG